MTKVVEPHTSEAIFIGEKAGGDENAGNCLTYLEDLTLQHDSGIVLTKNIHMEGNWDSSSSEKTAGGVITHRSGVGIVS